MSEQIKKREEPILGVSCPICGSVFLSKAFHTDFLNKEEHDENYNTLKELMEYAMQGMNLSIYKSFEYKLNSCEHIKNIN